MFEFLKNLFASKDKAIKKVDSAIAGIDQVVTNLDKAAVALEAEREKTASQITDLVSHGKNLYDAAQRAVRVRDRVKELLK